MAPKKEVTTLFSLAKWKILRGINNLGESHREELVSYFSGLPITINEELAGYSGGIKLKLFSDFRTTRVIIKAGQDKVSHIPLKKLKL